MSDEPIRLALVGCGRWGRNWLREIAGHPGAALGLVVDPDEAARAYVQSLHPDATVASMLTEARLSEVDAVVIASPPSLHAEHALIALRAGAHVLVEKPLTTDRESAERLVDEARRASRVAMVGHLMRYHPGVEALVGLVQEGRLGTIRYGLSTRLSPRKSEGSILFALAPHDLSLWRAITGAPLLRAEATSLGEHIATLRVESETKIPCYVELSRIHPTRERRFIVVGDEGFAIFDDGSEGPILSYGLRAMPTVTDSASFDACLANDPTPLEAVPFRPLSPLAGELDHFLSCIREDRLPRTAFDEGLEVVRLLARRGPPRP